MNKLVLLLGLCSLTVPCCTETRVVRDNSVTAKFMGLNGKNSFRVQLGDGSAQAKEREQQRAKAMASRPDTYNPNWNPLGNAKWSTNFQVDPNDPNGATVAPSAPPPPSPTGGGPLMGGMMLPDTSPR